MAKSNVLVNNPFLEEADDKFREVFFGSKSPENPSKEVVESISESKSISNELVVENTIITPSPMNVSNNNNNNNIISSQKENIVHTKTNILDLSDDDIIKRLERHNFKIYNSQVSKLRTVAKHLKSSRGDEVKADMSSILRYLIDSIDLDHMTTNFPKRH